MFGKTSLAQVLTIVYQFLNTIIQKVIGELFLMKFRELVAFVPG